MTYSLGEVEALCRKAARGAGFSWGMAEEAGKSVRWLCSWGLPGATALAHYLEGETETGPPDDPYQSDWSRKGRLCPLICSTLLSDIGANCTDLRLHSVAWPILMFPYWMDDVELRWQETIITQSGTMYFSGDPFAPLASTVEISRAKKPTGTRCTRESRVALNQDDLDALNRLAARTYAPETQASKLSGAGAGLTDED